MAWMIRDSEGAVLAPSLQLFDQLRDIGCRS